MELASGLLSIALFASSKVTFKVIFNCSSTEGIKNTGSAPLRIRPVRIERWVFLAIRILSPGLQAERIMA